MQQSVEQQSRRASWRVDDRTRKRVARADTPRRGRGRVAAWLLSLTGLLPAADLLAQVQQPMAIPDLNITTNGRVYAVLRHGSKIYIGGDFSEVNGVARSHIARLNTFNEVASAVDTGWNVQASAPVRAIVTDGSSVGCTTANGSNVLSGCNIYAAAEFNMIANTGRSYVAKFNSAGTLVNEWNPQPQLGTVNAIAIDNAGRVMIGGSFRMVGTDPSRTYLARLDKDTGALDTSFTYIPDGVVNALAFDIASSGFGQANLYVGGAFQTISGQSVPRLARFASDLSLDTAWRPAPDGVVHAVAVDLGARNDVYAGGEFATIGGQSRTGVAKLSADTTNPDAFGKADASWNASLSGTVRSIAINSAAQQVTVAGDFTAGTQKHVVRLQRFGADLVAGWLPQVDAPVDLAYVDGSMSYIGGQFKTVNSTGRDGFAGIISNGGLRPENLSVRLPGIVNAVVVDEDGGIVLGGDFSLVGGQGMYNLARAHGDGTLDSGFAPQPNGVVRALQRDAAGTLYVGGDYTQIAGQAIRHLARFGVDRSIDADWHPDPDRPVTALALDGNDALYAAGKFDNIGGMARHAVAKVLRSGTGSAVAGWQVAVDGAVNAIHVDDSHVYLGGAFQHVAANAQHALARVSAASGAFDADWRPLLDGPVHALAAANDMLYAAGEFQNANNAAVGLAARFPKPLDGAHDASWTADAGGPVYAIAFDAEGSIYLGGRFSTVRGTTRRAVVKYNAGGDLASDWSPAISYGTIYSKTPEVRSIVANDARGAVLVGGSFNTVTTTVRNGLAQIVTAQTRQLQYVAGPGGTLSGTVTQTVPNLGNGSAVTAVPDAGYAFLGWSDQRTDNPRTDLAVVRNITVTANFGRIPTAADVAFETLEDVPLVAQAITGTDADPSATFTLVDGPEKGTLSWVDAQAGTFTYTPDADANGSDVFSYKLVDGALESSVAAVMITITPVNDAPTVTWDVAPTHAGGVTGAVTVPGFATFSAGPADEVATQSLLGYTVEVVDDPDGVLVGNSAAIDAGGVLAYTLSGNAGVASLQAVARDNGGTANGGVDTSAVHSFTISVGDLADLQVSIDSEPAVTLPGGQVVQVIVVANNGPAAVLNAPLVAELPNGLANLQWACQPAFSNTSCPAAPYDAGTGTLVSYVSLASGDYLRFDLTADVTAADGATITSTVTVTAPTFVADPTPSNNTASATLRVRGMDVFADGFEAPASGPMLLPEAEAARYLD